eukprot:CAMPEP_0115054142 /NCGR_PEP_ID=MMETSP0227-20121206/3923_1 /TAXON_ID=89957 /ORGANISM="Polarella glacialis, Strain CCMP 1383" /LENGTH=149 /DNA_ID=CAMNT_0002438571 /DNA_START=68 /DNA_END=515 /DNA_ORIENTATION=-
MAPLPGEVVGSGSEEPQEGGAAEASQQPLGAGVREVVFDDSDRFYDEILDLVTEGRPFGFRLPFVHDGELPVRLRGLLRADPGDECELKSEEQELLHPFDRSFDDDTWQSWSEWGDGWSQQRTSTSTTAEAIAASVPLAAGNTPQMMLE